MVSNKLGDDYVISREKSERDDKAATKTRTPNGITNEESVIYLVALAPPRIVRACVPNVAAAKQTRRKINVILLARIPPPLSLPPQTKERTKETPSHEKIKSKCVCVRPEKENESR